MQESVVVAVEFDPGVEQVPDVGVGHEVRERGVAARRDHHLDPDAAPGRQPQGVEDHHRGQEVGRTDAHPLPGPDDGRRERLGDGQPRRALFGPCQLDRQPLPDAVRGDVSARVEMFPGGPRPIGDEESLEVRDGVAFDAKVLVAPLAHAISVEVVFRNIYATQIGGLSVRNDYFAVVAARGARGEPREADRFEGGRADPRLVHAPQHCAAQPPRTHGVVDDPHLQPGAGLADQDFGDGAADAVVADDVVLHVDRAGGVLQGGDERCEGVVAVVEQFDAVVPRGGGAAAPGDDLFYGVAPVDGLFGRGCGTAVSRQYVQQRAGHREQENQSQPHGRRSGYPLPARDDETRAERP